MNDIEAIKTAISDWVRQEVQIIPLATGEWEIKTIEPDAYGDDVLLFLKAEKDGFRLGDDGRLLFKFDPGAEEKELYENAANIAIGSGYDFDEDCCEIYCKAQTGALAGAIMRLAQLEVAISYLA